MPARLVFTRRLPWFLRFDVLALGFAIFWAAAGQANITGQATVVDGDTLEIRDQRIRLHGIDAPESAQRCFLDSEAYLCGQTAAFVLSNRIGRQIVACEEKDRDRYGRVVAICAAGGEDLNAFMVRNGWALAYRAYSGDYVGEEMVAKSDGLGLWRGMFVLPWNWRQGERSVAETEDQENSPPAGCDIKGNISRGGERIYHVPGGRWYTRSRIDESKGERWFCNEHEALAAGWRRAAQ